MDGIGMYVIVFEQKMLPAAILFHYLCFAVRFFGKRTTKQKKTINQ